MHREDEENQEVRPYAPQVKITFLETVEIKSGTFYTSTLDVAVFMFSIFTAIYLQNAIMTDAEDEVQKEIYSFDCVLYYMGAKHTPSIRYNYEFHRLIMPAVLHGSFGHIIGNLLIQIYYGFIHEQHFGIIRVALVYVIGAISGDLFSCVFFKYELSVGASAAIFGLLGLEVIYFIRCYRTIERLRLVIFIVVFPSLFLSLFDSTPGVDVAGHIGGLCVGLTLGSAYAFEDSRLNAKKILSRGCYVFTGLILASFLLVIFTMELENKQVCPEPK